MPGTRRRLDPDDRRSQLLDVGAEMFADRPYDQVLMQEVAAAAGVSRALVYRYFSTKRDLFAAIFQRASDRLLQATEVDGSLTLSQSVENGLDAHFDYFEANARTILVANRGELSGDPGVQAIMAAELGILRRRMLDLTELVGHDRAVAATALGGWLAFVRSVCLEWLTGDELSRDEVRALCLRTLVSALTAGT